MIIDTSALVAILRREPEAQAFVEAIAAAPARRISAGTYLELAIVIDGRGDPGASLLLDELLAELGITIESVTATQAQIARAAYRQYGRGTGGGRAGSGGPTGTGARGAGGARFNFGDCFAYALAKDLGEPLLFKGEDFAATDIGFVGPREERHRLRELLAPYEVASG
jgi:ribonuclease VapC